MKIFAPLDDFFFKPQSVTPIALYRILFGLLVCQLNFVHLAPDLFDWYGRHATVSVESVRAYLFFQQPYLDFLLLLPRTDFFVFLFFLVYSIAGVFLLFGFQTRVSAAIVFIGMLSLQHHNPYNMNSGDNFMRLLAFFLIFSAAGKAFSIDRLLQSLKEDWRKTGFSPVKAVPWAQRMMQIQLSFLYTQATYVKACGDEWRNGSAVYFASRLDDLMRFPIPILFDTKFIWMFLTWSTLVIESALGVLIWIKPLRYWIILLGTGLHLGIDTSMNIPMFEWLMLTAFLLFIEPEDLERVGAFLKKKLVKVAKAPVSLLYDGSDLSTVRVAGIVKRLDLFDNIELADVYGEAKSKFKAFLPSKNLSQLLVVHGGKKKEGFEAFVLLCQKLPLGWLLVPFVFTPVFALCSRLIFGSIWKKRERVFGAPPPEPLKTSHRLAGYAALVAGLGVLVYLNIKASGSPITEPNLYDVIVNSREKFAREEIKQSLDLSSLPQKMPEDAHVDPNSMESNKKVLTADDLKTLVADQSKSFDADKILAALQEEDQKNPPPELPDRRLKAMSRLADVYWQSNRLADADKLLTYVWKMRAAQVKQTNQHDPELLATMIAIADLYRDWGYFDRSIACYQQVLQYYTNLLPKNHSGLMTAKANLALIYYLAGQSTIDSKPKQDYYDHARSLFNECLPYYSARYGPQDSRYQNVAQNYKLLVRDTR